MASMLEGLPEVEGVKVTAFSGEMGADRFIIDDGDSKFCPVMVNHPAAALILDLMLRLRKEEKPKYQYTNQDPWNSPG